MHHYREITHQHNAACTNVKHKQLIIYNNPANNGVQFIGVISWHVSCDIKIIGNAVLPNL